MKPTGYPLIDETMAEWVVGSDEVGLGAYAGPLTVASVALPLTWTAPGVGDSKKLTDSQRQAAFKQWTEVTPVLFKIVSIEHDEIDKLGLEPALEQAHREAILAVLEVLPCQNPLVIVDGFKGRGHVLGVRAIGLPKADDLIPAVSLASIIAKVTRDNRMREYDQAYPGYGFGGHKGYGTAEHQAALDKLGVCPIHRRSFSPIARLVSAQEPVHREGYETFTVG